MLMQAVTIDDRVEPRAWHTLFITSVSMFLVSMDVTIVSVALPDIARSFRRVVGNALVGLHGVQRDVCRAAAAGRQARRPMGAQTGVPERPGDVRGGVAARRDRPICRRAHRCTHPPGDRERAHLPGVVGPALARVPDHAAFDGHRRVGWHRRARWGHRADPRRLARRVRRLAGGVLHQRAVRDHRGRIRDRDLA